MIWLSVLCSFHFFFPLWLQGDIFLHKNCSLHKKNIWYHHISNPSMIVSRLKTLLASYKIIKTLLAINIDHHVYCKWIARWFIEGVIDHAVRVGSTDHVEWVVSIVLVVLISMILSHTYLIRTTHKNTSCNICFSL